VPLNFKYGDVVTPSVMKNVDGLPFPSPKGCPSLDRATVRHETLSFFDFGPKKVFTSLTSSSACPLPSSCLLVSMGPDLWHRSSRVTPSSFDHTQQIRCCSKFDILLKYTEYRASHYLAHPTVQHVSSNMRSSSHDTSCNCRYHRQNSLSSTHSHNYLDHDDQPVGYHPVMQSPQVQRSTYSQPRDHRGMLPLIVNMSVNSPARRPPDRFDKPPYHPACSFPSLSHLSVQHTDWCSKIQVVPVLHIHSAEI